MVLKQDGNEKITTRGNIRRELVLKGRIPFYFGKYAKKNLCFKDVDYLELDNYLAWCESQDNPSLHMIDLIEDLTCYLSQEHIQAVIEKELGE